MSKPRSGSLRRSETSPAAPSLRSALAAAQSVRYIPDLAVAESEYRNAQEAWLKNDPDLDNPF